MKAGFLFVGRNLNRIIQKKKYQKKARFMDDALKRGLFYIWMLRLAYCLSPLSKFLATRLPQITTFDNNLSSQQQITTI